MPREFTQEQQRAISADGADLCVAAGAGSGKTGVLVERFVRLIVDSRAGALPPDQSATPEQILVITFTDKATREMKARIVEALTTLGLIEERRQIESAYISTIHALCSRLLQENPFEAGVDPQFKVFDPGQARQSLRAAFERVIEEAYDRDDPGITELVAAVPQAAAGGPDTDTLAQLGGSVETILARLRGGGLTLDRLREHVALGIEGVARASDEPVWLTLDPVLEDLNAAAAAIRQLRTSATGTLRLAAGAVLKQAEEIRPRESSPAAALKALKETRDLLMRARARPGAHPDEIDLGQVLHRLKTAMDGAKELLDAAADRETASAVASHRMLALTAEVWAAYEADKRLAGRLDNDDLQAEAVRLLETTPSVAARYRRRFRHLLVDEFQDTNPLQMRLIELLHAGPCEPHRNHLFIVGDVQQSIYSFRDAEPELFRALERRFRVGGEGLHVQLAANFRSRPEILKCVAAVFGEVWREEDTPFVPLTPGAEFGPKPGPSIELLLTQDLMRRDYVALEAEALGGRIRQLVEGEELRITSCGASNCGEPVRYRDVAVLLRSLTDIQRYEEAFARQGVPYFVVGGGRGYYARHEIRDLRNVLILIDTPLDDLALLAVLRSPFVGAAIDTLYRLALRARETDPNGRTVMRPLYPQLRPLLDSGELPPDETARIRSFLDVIEPLAEQEDRLLVGRLLERLVFQTRYDARLLVRPGGRRRLANVRKLLQMAHSDSVLGVSAFIRRLRDLERLSDREGEAPTEEEAADVVRIHTIHGAKGLEFPVVIVADLSRGLIVPEKGMFVCDPRTLAIGTKLTGVPNIAYTAIVRRREEADRRESARLLYVAMTRAREHLVLCGNVGRNKSFNWADNLFGVLGVLAAPEEPIERNLVGGMSARIAPLNEYVGAAPDGRRARNEAPPSSDEVLDWLRARIAGTE